MASGSSEIDSGIPPAVKNLRSKFEQLALETSAASSSRKPSSSHDLLTEPAAVPRPRTMSNNAEQRPDSQYLRNTSSSSDLKTLIKRPPPPPPPRGSKVPPSPRSSPLLRPVPIPPYSSSSSDISLSVPTSGSVISLNGDPAHSEPEAQDTPFSPPVGSVASLRNKFTAVRDNVSPGSSRPTTPKQAHTPRASFSGLQPASYSEQNFSTAAAPILPQRFADSPRVSYPSNQESDGVPSAGNSDSSLPIAPSASSSSFHSIESSFNHSPFSDGESDSEPSLSSPPSLLLGNNSNIPTNGSNHAREPSSDSAISPSSPTQLSSESESSLPTQRSPPRPQRPSVLPPRPPQRHAATLSPAASNPKHVISLQMPPPLPIRRSTNAVVEEVHHQSPPPPRLPARPSSVVPGMPPSPVSSVPDRKTIGVQRLPPPPTRTIALGDKLPPARRPPSPSSDEESGDEDDPKGVDSLPDASRSSRRPPVISCFNYSEFKVHVPAYTGRAVVAGSIVIVSHHHHLKGYDLTVSDAPVWVMDTKEMGLKDAKITSMEFRPASKEIDRGCFLWIGTKEGHLAEIDVRRGSVVSTKLGAHFHAVLHILRHGRSMLTVDDFGKVFIFDPDANTGEDVGLAFAQPRVFRITEKQEFVKLLGGKLWTSTRTDANGTGAMTKTPIVRVYDPFVPGSVGRSLLPTEHVGAVTSGTIVPSQPGNVYLGHEGGYISIWTLAGPGGVPQCIEVMKVSSSDVLSLDGVNDRLWAGGRQGMISAYDVAPRPWIVTNSWMAHSSLPVLKIAVDPYSIEKAGRLCVVSIGRDEQLRFWDGLLGIDWVEQELLKREKAFSTFRELNVLIVSWNADAAKPDALNGDPVNINFLQEALTSVPYPDIVSFGFQEVIDLESRKMAAKTVLLGSGKKKSDDGRISEKVTTAYKRWYDHLLLAVKLAMPPDTPYTVIHTESLVGLFSCIFVKNTERVSLKDISIATLKRGMGGRYGNKGGIVSRFVIDDSSICLINCHLAAGQHHVRQRNADVAAFLENKSIFPATSAIEEPLAYVGGGDGTMVLDHEIVFVNGDMNYRIDQRRDAAVAAIRAHDWASLLAHDQLTKEMKFNRGFRFRPFHEGPLTFPPTYKYDRRSNDFDSSEKRRVPAWCDRVLWRSRDSSRVHQLHYKRYEVNVSDHRPISAGFTMTVKSVRHEVRAQIKTEIQGMWADQQRKLLQAARDFYVDQALV